MIDPIPYIYMVSLVVVALLLTYVVFNYLRRREDGS